MVQAAQRHKSEPCFTPPRIDHAMRFLEDTPFLRFGRNTRRQGVYEADVEHIRLVKA